MVAGLVRSTARLTRLPLSLFHHAADVQPHQQGGYAGLPFRPGIAALDWLCRHLPEAASPKGVRIDPPRLRIAPTVVLTEDTSMAKVLFSDESHAPKETASAAVDRARLCNRPRVDVAPPATAVSTIGSSGVAAANELYASGTDDGPSSRTLFQHVFKDAAQHSASVSWKRWLLQASSSIYAFPDGLPAILPAAGDTSAALLSDACSLVALSAPSDSPSSAAAGKAAATSRHLAPRKQLQRPASASGASQRRPRTAGSTNRQSQAGDQSARAQGLRGSYRGQGISLAGGLIALPDWAPTDVLAPIRLGLVLRAALLRRRIAQYRASKLARVQNRNLREARRLGNEAEVAASAALLAVQRVPRSAPARAVLQGDLPQFPIAVLREPSWKDDDGRATQTVALTPATILSVLARREATAGASAVQAYVRSAGASPAVFRATLRRSDTGGGGSHGGDKVTAVALSSWKSYGETSLRPLLPRPSQAAAGPDSDEGGPELRTHGERSHRGAVGDAASRVGGFKAGLPSRPVASSSSSLAPPLLPGQKLLDLGGPGASDPLTEGKTLSLATLPFRSKGTGNKPALSRSHTVLPRPTTARSRVSRHLRIETGDESSSGPQTWSSVRRPQSAHPRSHRSSGSESKPLPNKAWPQRGATQRRSMTPSPTASANRRLPAASSTPSPVPQRSGGLSRPFQMLSPTGSDAGGAMPLRLLEADLEGKEQSSNDGGRVATSEDDADRDTEIASHDFTRPRSMSSVSGDSECGVRTAAGMSSAQAVDEEAALLAAMAHPGDVDVEAQRRIDMAFLVDASGQHDAGSRGTRGVLNGKKVSGWRGKGRSGPSQRARPSRNRTTDSSEAAYSAASTRGGSRYASGYSIARVAGKAAVDFVGPLRELCRFVETWLVHTGWRFRTLTCDFVRDTQGRVWLLNVHGFTLATEVDRSLAGLLDMSGMPVDGAADAPSGQQAASKALALAVAERATSGLLCQFCRLRYHPGEMIQLQEDRMWLASGRQLALQDGQSEVEEEVQRARRQSEEEERAQRARDEETLLPGLRHTAALQGPQASSRRGQLGSARARLDKLNPRKQSNEGAAGRSGTGTSKRAPSPTERERHHELAAHSRSSPSASVGVDTASTGQRPPAHSSSVSALAGSSTGIAGQARSSAFAGASAIAAQGTAGQVATQASSTLSIGIAPREAIHARRRRARLASSPMNSLTSPSTQRGTPSLSVNSGWRLQPLSRGPVLDDAETATISKRVFGIHTDHDQLHTELAAGRPPQMQSRWRAARAAMLMSGDAAAEGNRDSAAAVGRAATAGAHRSVSLTGQHVPRHMLKPASINEADRLWARLDMAAVSASVSEATSSLPKLQLSRAVGKATRSVDAALAAADKLLQQHRHPASKPSQKPPCPAARTQEGDSADGAVAAHSPDERAQPANRLGRPVSAQPRRAPKSGLGGDSSSDDSATKRRKVRRRGRPQSAAVERPSSRRGVAKLATQRPSSTRPPVAAGKALVAPDAVGADAPAPDRLSGSRAGSALVGWDDNAQQVKDEAQVFWERALAAQHIAVDLPTLTRPGIGAGLQSNSAAGTSAAGSGVAPAGGSSVGDGSAGGHQRSAGVLADADLDASHRQNKAKSTAFAYHPLADATLAAWIETAALADADAMKQGHITVGREEASNSGGTGTTMLAVASGASSPLSAESSSSSGCSDRTEYKPRGGLETDSQLEALEDAKPRSQAFTEAIRHQLQAKSSMQAVWGFTLTPHQMMSTAKQFAERGFRMDCWDHARELTLRQQRAGAAFGAGQYVPLRVCRLCFELHEAQTRLAQTATELADIMVVPIIPPDSSRPEPPLQSLTTVNAAHQTLVIERAKPAPGKNSSAKRPQSAGPSTRGDRRPSRADSRTSQPSISSFVSDATPRDDNSPIRTGGSRAAGRAKSAMRPQTAPRLQVSWASVQRASAATPGRTAEKSVGVGGGGIVARETGGDAFNDASTRGKSGNKRRGDSDAMDPGRGVGRAESFGSQQSGTLRRVSSVGSLIVLDMGGESDDMDDMTAELADAAAAAAGQDLAIGEGIAGASSQEDRSTTTKQRRRLSASKRRRRTSNRVSRQSPKSTIGAPGKLGATADSGTRFPAHNNEAPPFQSPFGGSLRDQVTGERFEGDTRMPSHSPTHGDAQTRPIVVARRRWSPATAGRSRSAPKGGSPVEAEAEQRRHLLGHLRKADAKRRTSLLPDSSIPSRSLPTHGQSDSQGSAATPGQGLLRGLLVSQAKTTERHGHHAPHHHSRGQIAREDSDSEDADDELRWQSRRERFRGLAKIRALVKGSIAASSSSSARLSDASSDNGDKQAAVVGKVSLWDRMRDKKHRLAAKLRMIALLRQPSKNQRSVLSTLRLGLDLGMAMRGHLVRIRVSELAASTRTYRLCLMFRHIQREGAAYQSSKVSRASVASSAGMHPAQGTVPAGSSDDDDLGDLGDVTGLDGSDELQGIDDAFSDHDAGARAAMWGAAKHGPNRRTDLPVRPRMMKELRRRRALTKFNPLCGWRRAELRYRLLEVEHRVPVRVTPRRLAQNGVAVVAQIRAHVFAATPDSLLTMLSGQALSVKVYGVRVRTMAFDPSGRIVAVRRGGRLVPLGASSGIRAKFDDDAAVASNDNDGAVLLSGPPVSGVGVSRAGSKPKRRSVSASAARRPPSSIGVTGRPVAPGKHPGSINGSPCSPVSSAGSGISSVMKSLRRRASFRIKRGRLAGIKGLLHLPPELLRAIKLRAKDRAPATSLGSDFGSSIDEALISGRIGHSTKDDGTEASEASSGSEDTMVSVVAKRISFRAGARGSATALIQAAISPWGIRGDNDGFLDDDDDGAGSRSSQGSETSRSDARPVVTDLPKAFLMSKSPRKYGIDPLRSSAAQVRAREVAKAKVLRRIAHRRKVAGPSITLRRVVVDERMLGSGTVRFGSFLAWGKGIALAKRDEVVPIVLQGAEAGTGTLGLSLGIGVVCDGSARHILADSSTVHTRGTGVYWPKEDFVPTRPVPAQWLAGMTAVAEEPLPGIARAVAEANDPGVIALATKQETTTPMPRAATAAQIAGVTKLAQVADSRTSGKPTLLGQVMNRVKGSRVSGALTKALNVTFRGILDKQTLSAGRSGDEVGASKAHVKRRWQAVRQAMAYQALRAGKDVRGMLKGSAAAERSRAKRLFAYALPQLSRRAGLSERMPLLGASGPGSRSIVSVPQMLRQEDAAAAARAALRGARKIRGATVEAGDNDGAAGEAPENRGKVLAPVFGVVMGGDTSTDSEGAVVGGAELDGAGDLRGPGSAQEPTGLQLHVTAGARAALDGLGLGLLDVGTLDAPTEALVSSDSDVPADKGGTGSLHVASSTSLRGQGTQLRQAKLHVGGHASSAEVGFRSARRRRGRTFADDVSLRDHRVLETRSWLRRMLASPSALFAEWAGSVTPDILKMQELHLDRVERVRLGIRAARRGRRRPDWSTAAAAADDPAAEADGSSQSSSSDDRSDGWSSTSDGNNVTDDDQKGRPHSHQKSHLLGGDKAGIERQVTRNKTGVTIQSASAVTGGPQGWIKEAFLRRSAKDEQLGSRSEMLGTVLFGSADSLPASVEVDTLVADCWRRDRRAKKCLQRKRKQWVQGQLQMRNADDARRLQGLDVRYPANAAGLAIAVSSETNVHHEPASMRLGAGAIGVAESTGMGGGPDWVRGQTARQLPLVASPSPLRLSLGGSNTAVLDGGPRAVGSPATPASGGAAGAGTPSRRAGLSALSRRRMSRIPGRGNNTPGGLMSPLPASAISTVPEFGSLMGVSRPRLSSTQSSIGPASSRGDDLSDESESGAGKGSEGLLLQVVPAQEDSASVTGRSLGSSRSTGRWNVLRDLVTRGAFKERGIGRDAPETWRVLIAALQCDWEPSMGNASGGADASGSHLPSRRERRGSIVARTKQRRVSSSRGQLSQGSIAGSVMPAAATAGDAAATAPSRWRALRKQARGGSVSSSEGPSLQSTESAPPSQSESDESVKLGIRPSHSVPSPQFGVVFWGADTPGRAQQGRADGSVTPGPTRGEPMRGGEMLRLQQRSSSGPTRSAAAAFQQVEVADDAGADALGGTGGELRIARAPGEQLSSLRVDESQRAPIEGVEGDAMRPSRGHGVNAAYNLVAEQIAAVKPTPAAVDRLRPAPPLEQAVSRGEELLSLPQGLPRSMLAGSEPLPDQERARSTANLGPRRRSPLQEPGPTRSSSGRPLPREVSRLRSDTADATDSTTPTPVSDGGDSTPSSSERSRSTAASRQHGPPSARSQSPSKSGRRQWSQRASVMPAEGSGVGLFSPQPRRGSSAGGNRGSAGGSDRAPALRKASSASSGLAPPPPARRHKASPPPPTARRGRERSESENDHRSLGGGVRSVSPPPGFRDSGFLAPPGSRDQAKISPKHTSELPGTHSRPSPHLSGAQLHRSRSPTSSPRHSLSSLRIRVPGANPNASVQSLDGRRSKATALPSPAVSKSSSAWGQAVPSGVVQVINGVVVLKRRLRRLRAAKTASEGRRGSNDKPSTPMARALSDSLRAETDRLIRQQGLRRSPSGRSSSKRGSQSSAAGSSESDHNEPPAAAGTSDHTANSGPLSSLGPKIQRSRSGRSVSVGSAVHATSQGAAYGAARRTARSPTLTAAPQVSPGLVRPGSAEPKMSARRTEVSNLCEEVGSATAGGGDSGAGGDRGFVDGGKAAWGSRPQYAQHNEPGQSITLDRAVEAWKELRAAPEARVADDAATSSTATTSRSGQPARTSQGASPKSLLHAAGGWGAAASGRGLSPPTSMVGATPGDGLAAFLAHTSTGAADGFATGVRPYWAVEPDGRGAVNDEDGVRVSRQGTNDAERKPLRPYSLRVYRRHGLRQGQSRRPLHKAIRERGSRPTRLLAAAMQLGSISWKQLLARLQQAATFMGSSTGSQETRAQKQFAVRALRGQILPPRFSGAVGSAVVGVGSGYISQKRQAQTASVDDGIGAAGATRTGTGGTTAATAHHGPLAHADLVPRPPRAVPAGGMQQHDSRLAGDRRDSTTSGSHLPADVDPASQVLLGKLGELLPQCPRHPLAPLFGGISTRGYYADMPAPRNEASAAGGEASDDMQAIRQGILAENERDGRCTRTLQPGALYVPLPGVVPDSDRRMRRRARMLRHMFRAVDPEAVGWVDVGELRSRVMQEAMLFELNSHQAASQPPRRRRRKNVRRHAAATTTTTTADRISAVKHAGLSYRSLPFWDAKVASARFEAPQWPGILRRVSHTRAADSDDSEMVTATSSQSETSSSSSGEELDAGRARAPFSRAQHQRLSTPSPVPDTGPQRWSATASQERGSEAAGEDQDEVLVRAARVPVSPTDQSIETVVEESDDDDDDEDGSGAAWQGPGASKTGARGSDTAAVALDSIGIGDALGLTEAPSPGHHGHRRGADDQMDLEDSPEGAISKATSSASKVLPGLAIRPSDLSISLATGRLGRPHKSPSDPLTPLPAFASATGVVELPWNPQQMQQTVVELQGTTTPLPTRDLEKVDEKPQLWRERRRRVRARAARATRRRLRFMCSEEMVRAYMATWLLADETITSLFGDFEAEACGRVSEADWVAMGHAAFAAFSEPGHALSRVIPGWRQAPMPIQASDATSRVGSATAGRGTAVGHDGGEICMVFGLDRYPCRQLLRDCLRHRRRVLRRHNRETLRYQARLDWQKRRAKALEAQAVPRFLPHSEARGPGAMTFNVSEAEPLYDRDLESLNPLAAMIARTTVPASTHTDATRQVSTAVRLADLAALDTDDSSSSTDTMSSDLHRRRAKRHEGKDEGSAKDEGASDSRSSAGSYSKKRRPRRESTWGGVTAETSKASVRRRFFESPSMPRISLTSSFRIDRSKADMRESGQSLRHQELPPHALVSTSVSGHSSKHRWALPMPPSPSHRSKRIKARSAASEAPLSAEQHREQLRRAAIADIQRRRTMRLASGSVPRSLVRIVAAPAPTSQGSNSEDEVAGPGIRDSEAGVLSAGETAEDTASLPRQVGGRSARLSRAGSAATDATFELSPRSQRSGPPSVADNSRLSPRSRARLARFGRLPPGPPRVRSAAPGDPRGLDASFARHGRHRSHEGGFQHSPATSLERLPPPAQKQQSSQSRAVLRTTPGTPPPRHPDHPRQTFSWVRGQEQEQSSSGSPESQLRGADIILRSASASTTKDHTLPLLQRAGVSPLPSAPRTVNTEASLPLAVPGGPFILASPTSATPHRVQPVDMSSSPRSALRFRGVPLWRAVPSAPERPPGSTHGARKPQTAADTTQSRTRVRSRLSMRPNRGCGAADTGPVTAAANRGTTNAIPVTMVAIPDQTTPSIGPTRLVPTQGVHGSSHGLAGTKPTGHRDDGSGGLASGERRPPDADMRAKRTGYGLVSTAVRGGTDAGTAAEGTTRGEGAEMRARTASAGLLTSLAGAPVLAGRMPHRREAEDSGRGDGVKLVSRVAAAAMLQSGEGQGRVEEKRKGIKPKRSKSRQRRARLKADAKFSHLALGRSTDGVRRMPRSAALTALIEAAAQGRYDEAEVAAVALQQRQVRSPSSAIWLERQRQDAVRRGFEKQQAESNGTGRARSDSEMALRGALAGSRGGVFAGSVGGEAGEGQQSMLDEGGHYALTASGWDPTGRDTAAGQRQAHGLRTADTSRATRAPTSPVLPTQDRIAMADTLLAEAQSQADRMAAVMADRAVRLAQAAASSLKRKQMGRLGEIARLDPLATAALRRRGEPTASHGATGNAAASRMASSGVSGGHGERLADTRHRGGGWSPHGGGLVPGLPAASGGGPPSQGPVPAGQGSGQSQARTRHRPASAAATLPSQRRTEPHLQFAPARPGGGDGHVRMAAFEERARGRGSPLLPRRDIASQSRDGRRVVRGERAAASTLAQRQRGGSRSSAVLPRRDGTGEAGGTHVRLPVLPLPQGRAEAPLLLPAPRGPAAHASDRPTQGSGTSARHR